jgi:hypothetical protein
VFVESEYVSRFLELENRFRENTVGATVSVGVKRRFQLPRAPLELTSHHPVAGVEVKRVGGGGERRKEGPPRVDQCRAASEIVSLHRCENV